MSTAKGKKLVIATSSKSRLALLGFLGIDYMAIEPKVKENYGGLGPRETVLNNAMRKASSVVGIAPENSVIVGLDTIIIDSSYRIIGKPHTLQFHSTVLRALSGSWHRVVTGAYIIDVPENTTDSFVEETRVKFKKLSDSEIRMYMASMEGLGRAGGYAIQGIASLLIERIEGDYYNVAGLPLHKLYTTLLKHGINLLEQSVKSRIIKQKGDRGKVPEQ